MSTYPNDAECLRLLKDAGCKKRVIVHCCTVRVMADEIARGIPAADPELVTAGALLHDIGRAVDHSIMHANIGADMIRDKGMPDELVRIVRKHTGAGLSDKDAAMMGLPPGDYIPRTIEEKIVAHADNLVSDNRLVVHEYSVKRLSDKGASEGAQRIADLHHELSQMYGEDLDILVRRLGEYPVLKGPCGRYAED